LAELTHYPLPAAVEYERNHSRHLRAQLTTLREQACLRRALKAAGSPQRVLDLPCGTGRFWPVYAASGVKQLIAADNSPGMLEVAAGKCIEGLPHQLIQASAFDLRLPDDSVDLVSCIRFYHHLSRSEDRLGLLDEFKRVSTRFVIVSTWVDGNLMSLERRIRRAPRRRARGRRSATGAGYGRRICRTRQETEAEFSAAGFEIVSRFDVWPKFQMWRFYLLAHGNG